jgi:hypothetical protein
VGIARRAAGGIALRTLLAVARPWRRLRRPSQGSARRSMPWRPNLYSSRRSGCLSHALRRRLSPGCGPPHGRSTGLAKKRAVSRLWRWRGRCGRRRWRGRGGIKQRRERLRVPFRNNRERLLPRRERWRERR